VASDPEPDNLFSVAHAYGAIRTRNANRPEALIKDESLEP
jgi:hypothetical protein